LSYVYVGLPLLFLGENTGKIIILVKNDRIWATSCSFARGLPVCRDWNAQLDPLFLNFKCAAARTRFRVQRGSRSHKEVCKWKMFQISDNI